MNPIIDSTLAASAALHHTVNRTASPQTTADSVRADDGVYLTQQATYLDAVQRALEPTPPLDIARIESLRQAIAEGNYLINPQTIAQRMLEWDGQWTQ